MNVTRYEAKYMSALTNTCKANGEISLKERIRKGRAKFAAMAGTYFVGAFNDNFFKQAAMLTAVAVGRSQMQGYATVIFTLPFILLAAPAGWCADRFSKRSVVICAKLLELGAMTFGAFGIIYGRWDLILVMLGIEGMQATMFSPALNGSIPELYPAEYVITANAIIRMISMASILGGIASAGFILDIKGSMGTLPLNHFIVAAVVIGISAMGVLISFGVAKFPAAAPETKFPWRGPIETLKMLYQIRKDRLLAVSIAANAVFWFIGSLQVLAINQLGLSQLGLSSSWTSGLVVAELAGIAAGGFISTRLAVGARWYRVLAPSGLLIAVFMIITGAIAQFGNHAKLAYLFASFLMMGMAGGVFTVPLESFIQVRPGADRKGATIAAANFAAFCGILLSGPVLNMLNACGISPANDFAIMGIISAAGTGVLFALLRNKAL
jgi:hypothetical protein